MDVFPVLMPSVKSLLVLLQAFFTSSELKEGTEQILSSSLGSTVLLLMHVIKTTYTVNQK